MIRIVLGIHDTGVTIFNYNHYVIDEFVFIHFHFWNITGSHRGDHHDMIMMLYEEKRIVRCYNSFFKLSLFQFIF